MCSIDFSPFSFTWVSNRKDGHDRTEKQLCLMTRMRSPSSRGCDRAVDWPTAALSVGCTETLRFVCVGCMEPSISDLWWGLWSVCVTDVSFPHLCWNDESQMGEGASVWACVDHRGASWESLAWAGMRHGGSKLVTLSFFTILYPLTVLLSLYSPQDYFLVTIGELLLISGNNEAAMATLNFSPFCFDLSPHPPGLPFLSLLFLLNVEWRRWGHW